MHPRLSSANPPSLSCLSELLSSSLPVHNLVYPVHGTFFFLLVEISKYKAMGLCASLHKSVGIEASCLCVRFAPFLSTAVVFRSADSCSEERSQLFPPNAPVHKTLFF
jgi:hypothetical protein